MKVYGIKELGEAVGAKPATVSAWYARGKLPEPTAKLGMGPVWIGAEVERWIKEQTRD